MTVYWTATYIGYNECNGFLGKCLYVNGLYGRRPQIAVSIAGKVFFDSWVDMKFCLNCDQQRSVGY